jgi:hypothetical protein
MPLLAQFLLLHVVDRAGGVLTAPERFGIRAVPSPSVSVIGQPVANKLTESFRWDVGSCCRRTVEHT